MEQIAFELQLPVLDNLPTEVLDQLWGALHARARREKTTISALVRQAVRERYLGSREQRMTAMQRFVGVGASRGEHTAAKPPLASVFSSAVRTASSMLPNFLTGAPVIQLLGRSTNGNVTVMTCVFWLRIRWR